VIKKGHINICPILDGYGVMTVFSFPNTNSCEVGLPYGMSLISMRGLAKAVLLPRLANR
jgi:hypothetical protein